MSNPKTNSADDSFGQRADVRPRVGIVIVNYNGTNDTLECLGSLGRIDYENYEIIVVDNASSDASFVFSEISKNYPGVKALALPRNLGFAGGNNAGIKLALENGAHYVLLINNDTIVAPDFLTRLVEAAELDKNIGFVGAKIYYFADKTRIWFNGGEFSWTNGGKHTQDGEIDANQTDNKIKDTAYVTGCALLAKKEVLEKIGALSEDYFMYYEDIDWSLSAQKAGYRTVVAPAAHIWHKISRSTSKMGAATIHYYHVRNAMILTKKHAPPTTKILVYAWSIIHYLKQPAKLMFGGSTSKHVTRAIMWGIGDFYRGKYGKMD